ncbi:uncharacterized protein LOC107879164 [Capsicum annuum]|uniref:uncharacterized protein LOC107879164 n=1 Tax=Capsicum annuum TaxID=4072 RepID=UPI0007BF1F90|nr:uncharacterized protein LOC107879164 [Capsicum annuum]
MPIPGLNEKSKDKDKESSCSDIEDLESSEVTNEQQEKIQTNVRAISLFLYAVSGEECDKISMCETIKEIWDKLEKSTERRWTPHHLCHSDHREEFENKAFEEYCAQNGYSQNFSSPRSPQQNSMVERQNRSLQETARTILFEHKLPYHFWAEAKTDEALNDESWIDAMKEELDQFE